MLGWLKQTATAITRPHRPDAQWIAEASQLYPNTPDLWWLSRRHFQLLFVYGTQMRGHPQHELVMNYGAYAATTYTDGKFSLWKKRLGKESFPIALEDSTPLPDGHLAAGWKPPTWSLPPRARVQGELYALETPQMYALDKHYENTLEFKRKRVPLIIPYHKLYRIPYENSDTQKQIAEAIGTDFKDQVVTSESCVELVRAWVYIGKSDYWTNQSDHLFSPGNTFRSRKGWLGDYYAFTKEEYSK